MATRPLLTLPNPTDSTLPSRGGGGPKLRLPTRPHQISTYGPVFDRLRQTLARHDGVMTLRNDPGSLAPDRVIVFEIAGSIDNFRTAVAKVKGLEFLAELETELQPDANFALIDKRKGRQGQDRTDKLITGRFYLAMPDVTAFNQLLRLWDQWEKTGKLDRGFAPFGDVFKHLHNLRPWGPIDRIPDETIEFWREESTRHPDRPTRTEVELWFYPNTTKREKVSTDFKKLMTEIGGSVIHEAVISEIAYHGMLVDVPAGEIQKLMTRQAVKLAIADDVMFLRPQSLLICPTEVEPFDGPSHQVPAIPTENDAPIAALLDGVPIELHSLLKDRLSLDDPDDLRRNATVARRVHGTAMASLILHGDLNAKGPPLNRLLYVRPLLLAPENEPEHSDGNRLLTDTVHRAVLRMRGSAGEEAAAPPVFIVNLSIGDPRRPFTQSVSPLARLLDYLAAKYALLFLVSAGNVTTAFTVPGFSDWTSFTTALPADRAKAILTGLNAAKHERSILSPAESLNALTIGAQHHDDVINRMPAPHAVDPFDDPLFPNASSALGLGYRRAIKPEIYLPGGREHLRMKRTGGGVEVDFGFPQRLYGLSAAAPDTSGQGRTDQLAMSDGTSSATALATRAAHRIFDALMDPDGPSPLRDMDPAFYAVVVKTLLVHRARWNDKGDLLKDICGPADKKRVNERSENVSRFLGFGVPDINEAIECAANRATMIGFGTLKPEEALNYRIPLPPSLERVTDPRSLTITLAWFSPIKPDRQNYRCVRLEAAPLQPIEALGIKRQDNQPADNPVKRGTVFHEHFSGAKAVPFIDDGCLNLQVWCKEDVGGITDEIRFGIAISIEAEGAIPIYEEIEQRLRVAPRP
jgi:Subtilase family